MEDLEVPDISAPATMALVQRFFVKVSPKKSSQKCQTQESVSPVCRPRRSLFSYVKKETQAKRGSQLFNCQEKFDDLRICVPESKSLINKTLLMKKECKRPRTQSILVRPNFLEQKKRRKCSFEQPNTKFLLRGHTKPLQFPSPTRSLTKSTDLAGFFKNMRVSFFKVENRCERKRVYSRGNTTMLDISLNERRSRLFNGRTELSPGHLSIKRKL